MIRVNCCQHEQRFWVYLIHVILIIVQFSALFIINRVLMRISIDPDIVINFSYHRNNTDIQVCI